MKTIQYKTLVILLTAVLSACNNHPQNKPKEETEAAAGLSPTKTALVPTLEEDKSEETTYISVRGYIDVPPENRVSISPVYGGYVESIHVLSGMKVNKGDALFTLQNPFYIELQQQYLESLAQIDYLKEDYERQKVLVDEEIASRKSYTKAASEYKGMLATVNGLKEKLKLLGLPVASIEKGKLTSSVVIYSPIQGSITEVNIQKGAFLDPQDVAVSILNTDHLHLELEVFEKDASRVKKGQFISFTVPEVSDVEHTGYVHLVVPSIHMDKRTFLVHGHINEASITGILPGMYVNARIKKDQ